MDQNEELKRQVQSEMAKLVYEELIEEMQSKCFNKCVTKPGSSLDSYEQRCLGNCMDRFIDSYNLVTKMFTSRIFKNNSFQ